MTVFELVTFIIHEKCKIFFKWFFQKYRKELGQTTAVWKKISSETVNWYKWWKSRKWTFNKNKSYDYNSCRNHLQRLQSAPIWSVDNLEGHRDWIAKRIRHIQRFEHKTLLLANTQNKFITLTTADEMSKSLWREVCTYRALHNNFR